MLLEKKSVQQLNKSWRHTSFSKNAIKADSLFDIGKNTNLFTGYEKAFYEEQGHARECRLNEEIDEEYVLEKQQQLEEE